MTHETKKVVMAGLDPATQRRCSDASTARSSNVAALALGGRVKPGHDGKIWSGLS
jgi:hypothetical protein